MLGFNYFNVDGFNLFFPADWDAILLEISHEDVLLLILVFIWDEF
jgi:hypothetical protein